MLTVTILDKDYYIRDKWEDNTINQMQKAQDYIDNMPLYLSSYIYSDKEVSLSNERLFSFYIDWIEIFSDIPREYLESEISINDSDDLGLIDLFNSVSKFLGEPTEIEPSEVIEFKGRKFYLIDSVKTVGGINKMLGGATFKHFSESQALAKLFQDKRYKKWDYLSRITAILFREDKNEMYSEELIDVRAKLFRDLPISEAYKGYFFLFNHTNKLQESLLTSLKEVAEKEEKAQTLLTKQSSMKCTGILKLMKSLKRVFSIKKD